MGRCLSLLLSMLIVFQSALAVADAHLSHSQDSQQHSAAVSDVADFTTVQATAPAITSEPAAGDLLDCQHCCHCHGATPLVLAGQGYYIDAVVRSVGSSTYHFDYPSVFSSPGLRPPIA
tara:strand:+ start:33260 stop:33616 length:357 start_codon:yes stop_codon:yes gene_type:complete